MKFGFTRFCVFSKKKNNTHRRLVFPILAKVSSQAPILAPLPKRLRSGSLAIGSPKSDPEIRGRYHEGGETERHTKHNRQHNRPTATGAGAVVGT